VGDKVTLKRGYNMAWQGDFENQQRAEKRLKGIENVKPEY
jgi:cobalt-zinc-cadmium resistance protein CzcA